MGRRARSRPARGPAPGCQSCTRGLRAQLTQGRQGGAVPEGFTELRRHRWGQGSRISVDGSGKGQGGEEVGMGRRASWPRRGTKRETPPLSYFCFCRAPADPTHEEAPTQQGQAASQGTRQDGEGRSGTGEGGMTGPEHRNRGEAAREAGAEGAHLAQL